MQEKYKQSPSQSQSGKTEEGQAKTNGKQSNNDNSTNPDEEAAVKSTTSMFLRCMMQLSY